jgi:hypothetical protein
MDLVMAKYVLKKVISGSQFVYTVYDESGNVVSTRTSSRSYVACTADGEFYFCRLSLIGSAIRKYERAISDLSAIESGASARQVLGYYKRTIYSDYNLDDLRELASRAEVRLPKLRAIAYLAE